LLFLLAGQGQGTEEFERMADRWHNASQWNDDRLADQIRQDEIDILIDLSGHTAGNRLSVLACKPASDLGARLGPLHARPDCRRSTTCFADPVTIPVEVRHLYKKPSTICHACYHWKLFPRKSRAQRSLPLQNGYVTFGVFNRISKISESATGVWAQILDRVAGSRLLIKDTMLDDSMIRESLVARLARYGITADRIDLRGGSPRLEHLAAFNEVDLCLDPFPQNGGASTWEALRMGVPVVAKLGNALPKRAAGGILTSVGLSDWSRRAQRATSTSQWDGPDEPVNSRNCARSCRKPRASAAGNPSFTATPSAKPIARCGRPIALARRTMPHPEKPHPKAALLRRRCAASRRMTASPCTTPSFETHRFRYTPQDEVSVFSFRELKVTA